MGIKKQYEEMMEDVRQYKNKEKRFTPLEIIDMYNNGSADLVLVNGKVKMVFNKNTIE